MCLAPADGEDPNQSRFNEHFDSAILLLEAGYDVVAFGLIRHMIEIGLRNSIWGNVLWPEEAHSHNLHSLLVNLDPAHPIAKRVGDASELADLILDLHRNDPKGDSSRYGRHRDGSVSLNEVCCIERADLLRLSELAYSDLCSPLGPSKDASN